MGLQCASMHMYMIDNYSLCTYTLQYRKTSKSKCMPQTIVSETNYTAQINKTFDHMYQCVFLYKELYGSLNRIILSLQQKKEHWKIMTPAIQQKKLSDSINK